MRGSRRQSRRSPVLAAAECLERRSCPAATAGWLRHAARVEPPTPKAAPIVSTIAPAASIAAVAGAATRDPGAATGSWTILVAMTGDDLNSYAARNINQMEKAVAALPPDVHIVVSWDQPPSSVDDDFPTGDGTQPAWDGYGRAVLVPDTDMRSIATPFDLGLGEQNTGDPATLDAFISWAVAAAPARHYGLVLWGHGGGLDGSQFDSESNDDPLTLDEVAAALTAPGVPPFEFTAYDACLMGMTEVAFAMAGAGVGTFVASQESIAANGYDYSTAFKALATATPDAVTPRQIAAGMVASYGRQYARQPQKLDTLAATSLSGVDGLTTALSHFVAATTAGGLTTANRLAVLAAARATTSYENPAGGKSFRDLGGFMSRVAANRSLPRAVRDAAGEVKAGLAGMLVAKTADRRRSGGLSVFLPDTRFDAYLETYSVDAAVFCRATGWDTFVTWLTAPVKVTVGGTRSATVTQRAFARLAGGS